MYHMLTPVEKDIMQEQMGNKNKVLETKKENDRNKKKHSLTKIKNAHHGLIVRLYTTKEKIRDFKDGLLETSQAEVQREKKNK